MHRTLISAVGLTKVYKSYPRPLDRLREALTRRPRHRAFHALEDVTFEVQQGMSLGIIGENGAGKSTLLKILSSVTAPTRGELRVDGNVASLLELGSGFHPELTGRQNIRLNAAMLGLAEEDVERRMPEMIAFSELGEFIDRPVKTYSTGMAMRLGFSIAVQVEPDILIIDEALSVGDGYFQKKCMDRLQAFLATGRVLIFCSHAMYYVSAFCQRALWLRHGRVEALGEVDEVVRAYEAFLTAKSTRAEPARESPSVETSEGSPAKISAVHFPGHESDSAPMLFHASGRWQVEVEWQVESPEVSTHVAVCVNRKDGIEVCSFGTHRAGLPAFTGRRWYRASLEVPRLPLIKGEFTLYLFLLDEKGLHVYDQRVLRDAFAVKSPAYDIGLVAVEHRWQDLSGATPRHPEPAVEAPPEPALERVLG